VVTTLFNTDYPLIRFGTGPLGAAARTSPAAAPNCDKGLARRRTDHQDQGCSCTSQVRDRAAHPEIARARLVVDNAGGATDDAQCRAGSARGIRAIVASIREITAAGEVAFRPRRAANEGVIDDVRKYD